MAFLAKTHPGIHRLELRLCSGLVQVLLLSVLLFGAPVLAQSPTEPTLNSQSYELPGSSSWSLTSIKGRTYQIFLAVPEGEVPESGWPVIYLLDAEGQFATLVQAVRLQSESVGPVVVVGIGYTNAEQRENRSYDLIPPVEPEDLPPPIIGDSWSPHGGSELFLEFILDEVKPSIERKVRIDSSREALFGHSLGGLFVLHVLFTQPDAFDTFIAASPSIWWGGRMVLSEVSAFEAVQQQSNTPRRLLIMVGGMEDELSPEEEKAAIQLDPLDEARRFYRDVEMIGNALRLAQRLSKLEPHGLRVGFAILAGETHMSVISGSLSRAPRFFLLPEGMLNESQWKQGLQ